MVDGRLTIKHRRRLALFSRRCHPAAAPL